MWIAMSLLRSPYPTAHRPWIMQQLGLMLGKLTRPPGELGKIGELLTGNGYFSESNVNACAAAGDRAGDRTRKVGQRFRQA